MGNGRAETAERLILAKRIEPIIVVGVSNTRHRTAEYTLPSPPNCAELCRTVPNGAERSTKRPRGRGDLYGRFLVEELKPFIDKTYRTRPGREHTAIGGSSLGGLISLYLASKHPDVFSKCAVVPPALAWNKRQILRQIEKDGEWLRRVGVARRQDPALPLRAALMGRSALIRLKRATSERRARPHRSDGRRVP